MSTDTAAVTHTEHEHPSDAKYVQIAILLAALTAAEVSTYFVDIGPILIPALISGLVIGIGAAAVLAAGAAALALRNRGGGSEEPDEAG